MQSDGVVIVGAGQAGFQVASSLRMAGYEEPIALIGDEPNVPYQRPPLSKGFMLGKQDIEGTALRPLAFYESHRISLLTGTKVTEIDRVDRSVTLASGHGLHRCLHYDGLVLAVGARNRKLDVKGAQLDGVLYLRTDTELVTKKKLQANAKNLDYFDAIAFFTTGELDMDDSQKADLLSFVHDDGKGFIGMHTAGDTFYKWPAFGEMVGGYFDQHPWMTFPAPVIVEDPSNPIVSKFPANFTIRDEIYQYKDWSRDKCRVLMSLDASKLDLANKNVHRTDKDFAVAWIKKYGKGRVFATTLGHVEEVYDRPDVQSMFVEAIKWSMGMTPEGDLSPVAKRAD